MRAKEVQVYVLQGFVEKDVKIDGELVTAGEKESIFTHEEKELALTIAKSWYVKGWEPYLFSKTYDGNFKVCFDFRVEQQKLSRRKAA